MNPHQGKETSEVNKSSETMGSEQFATIILRFSIPGERERTGGERTVECPPIVHGVVLVEVEGVMESCAAHDE